MTIKGLEIQFSPNMDVTIVSKKNFSKGEIIEVCPIVMLSRRDSYFTKVTLLNHFSFWFNERMVVAGGYSLFYPSSKDPNASYRISPERRTLEISANRKIKSGESISVRKKALSPRAEYNNHYSSLWHSDGLVVRPSPGRGFGVFTKRKFKKGEFVEVSPVIRFSEIDTCFLAETKLDGFLYSWGCRKKLSVLPIGYPCFYNHSDNSNINPWDEMDSIEDLDHMAVRALRDLEPGTELLFDYSGGAKKKNLGFSPI